MDNETTTIGKNGPPVGASDEPLQFVVALLHRLQHLGEDNDGTSASQQRWRSVVSALAAAGLSQSSSLPALTKHLSGLKETLMALDADAVGRAWEVVVPVLEQLSNKSDIFLHLQGLDELIENLSREPETAANGLGLLRWLQDRVENGVHGVLELAMGGPDAENHSARVLEWVEDAEEVLDHLLQEWTQSTLFRGGP